SHARTAGLIRRQCANRTFRQRNKGARPIRRRSGISIRAEFWLDERFEFRRHRRAEEQFRNVPQRPQFRLLNILRVSALKVEKTAVVSAVAEVDTPQPGGAGCGTLLLTSYRR